MIAIVVTDRRWTEPYQPLTTSRVFIRDHVSPVYCIRPYRYLHRTPTLPPATTNLPVDTSKWGVHQTADSFPPVTTLQVKRDTHVK